LLSVSTLSIKVRALSSRMQTNHFMYKVSRASTNEIDDYLGGVNATLCEHRRAPDLSSLEFEESHSPITTHTSLTSSFKLCTPLISLKISIRPAHHTNRAHRRVCVFSHTRRTAVRQDNTTPNTKQQCQSASRTPV
jgi:hypothetical protein